MILRNTGVIKHKNVDFQVNESYLIDQSLMTDKTNHLLILKKCGFSTFDAVQILSKHFNISTSKITYYGLKDEDGITQQLINLQIDKETLIPLVNQINHFYENQDHYIYLTYLHASPHPLKVGDLTGNNFLLTVRKLPQSTADKFKKLKTLKLLFLNYYGPQRFSLPNHEPTTHLIGEALLQANYDKALSYIKVQKSKLGDYAVQYTGESQTFFELIDSREKNFFINSYYSHLWNHELKSLLINSNINLSHYTENSIEYLFSDSNELRYTKVPDMLMHRKVRGDDSKSIVYQSMRAAMLQVFFKISNIAIDECFDDYYKVQLEFSLPSGSYATMAIAQLLYQIEQYE